MHSFTTELPQFNVVEGHKTLLRHCCSNSCFWMNTNILNGAQLYKPKAIAVQVFLYTPLAVIPQNTIAFWLPIDMSMCTVHDNSMSSMLPTSNIVGARCTGATKHWQNIPTSTLGYHAVIWLLTDLNFVGQIRCKQRLARLGTPQVYSRLHVTSKNQCQGKFNHLCCINRPEHCMRPNDALLRTLKAQILRELNQATCQWW